MRPPRLIATDLDGTFLSPDESVSEENSAAVLAAQEAGITVVFATGRPIRWLEVIKGLPGAHPLVIASNGAALYDAETEKIVDRICIETASALDAVERIRTIAPDVRFAFESGTRFGHEPHYSTWAPDNGDPDIFAGPVETIVHDDLVKMLVQSPSLHSDQLLARVDEAIGDRLSATHSTSRGYGLVEVSAPGVDKGAMLARFCQQLGVEAAEVAAFGDMPNDLSMLGWVGLPYVVANAHPDLLQRGFATVPANSESGVGRTIRQWLR
ncbi:MAG: Cof-type HAD-IIB family hydrolase [Microlunatus sp.]|nr:Cof-type HAD-IIB family hydrolase [Microlunatus sp.]